MIWESGPFSSHLWGLHLNSQRPSLHTFSRKTPHLNLPKHHQQLLAYYSKTWAYGGISHPNYHIVFSEAALWKKGKSTEFVKNGRNFDRASTFTFRLNSLCLPLYLFPLIAPQYPPSPSLYHLSEPPKQPNNLQRAIKVFTCTVQDSLLDIFGKGTTPKVKLNVLLCPL